MLELFPRPLHRSLLTSWILLFVSTVAWGQTASLRGQVVDQSGAVIPKAAVALNGPSGLVKTTTTAENGSHSFEGLQPGEYTVQAAAPKLEQDGKRASAINASSIT